MYDSDSEATLRRELQCVAGAQCPGPAPASCIAEGALFPASGSLAASSRRGGSR